MAYPRKKCFPRITVGSSSLTQVLCSTRSFIDSGSLQFIDLPPLRMLLSSAQQKMVPRISHSSSQGGGPGGETPQDVLSLSLEMTHICSTRMPLDEDLPTWLHVAAREAKKCRISEQPCTQPDLTSPGRRLWEDNRKSITP